MYSALNSKSATANKPPMKLQKHCKSVTFIIVASYVILTFCTMNLIKLDL